MKRRRSQGPFSDLIKVGGTRGSSTLVSSTGVMCWKPPFIVYMSTLSLSFKMRALYADYASFHFFPSFAFSLNFIAIPFFDSASIPLSSSLPSAHRYTRSTRIASSFRLLERSTLRILQFSSTFDAFTLERNYSPSVSTTTQHSKCVCLLHLAPHFALSTLS